MAIHITRLNGGDITIGSSGGGSTPSGYTLTLIGYIDYDEEYGFLNGDVITVIENGQEKTYKNYEVASEGVVSKTITNVT